MQDQKNVFLKHHTPQSTEKNIHNVKSSARNFPLAGAE